VDALLLLLAPAPEETEAGERPMKRRLGGTVEGAAASTAGAGAGADAITDVCAVSCCSACLTDGTKWKARIWDEEKREEQALKHRDQLSTRTIDYLKGLNAGNMAEYDKSTLLDVRVEQVLLLETAYTDYPASTSLQLSKQAPNNRCMDCGSPHPQWASVKWVITIRYCCACAELPSQPWRLHLSRMLGRA